MPELPEVETTVQGLQRKLSGLTILDVWSDLPKNTISRPDYRQTIKYLPFFTSFKKTVKNKKVISVRRRAKNILIELEGGNTILIHMKMTGHLMIGNYIYNKQNNQWAPAPDEKNVALRDPFNRFLHVVFSLSNKKQLVFSDARKFGKITLLSTSDIHNSSHLGHIGPEPLETSFTNKKFADRLQTRPQGKIKQVLMDQAIVAGIGNIYSDEMLWIAGIHPLSRVNAIPPKLLQKLYTAMKKVLKNGIDFGGDSTSDYRDIDGKPGKFNYHHRAYQKTGAPCTYPHCKGVIKRVIIGGRSAHFCPSHQKMLK